MKGELLTDIDTMIKELDQFQIAASSEKYIHIIESGVANILFILLDGISGGGKDASLKYINSIFCREGIDPQKIIRHTTRDIRNGEREGIDYHYVTGKEFEKLKEEDSLVYWEYYPPLGEDEKAKEENKLYGISKQALSVLKDDVSGKKVFTSVAGNGTPKVINIIDQCYKQVVGIPLYIYCNADEIEERLKSDGRPITDLLFRLKGIKNDLLNFFALEKQIQQSYLLINNSSNINGVWGRFNTESYACYEYY